MKITPGKARAKAYSDYYKNSSGNSTPSTRVSGPGTTGTSGSKIKREAVPGKSTISSTSPFKNRNEEDDEEETKLKKEALKRRLSRMKKAGN